MASLFAYTALSSATARYIQTSAVESVMDGDLDAFIKGYLMEFGAQA